MSLIAYRAARPLTPAATMGVAVVAAAAMLARPVRTACVADCVPAARPLTPAATMGVAVVVAVDAGSTCTEGCLIGPSCGSDPAYGCGVFRCLRCGNLAMR